ncbi:hypothetical protein BJ508DRAFT_316432, partial [Ascobolus immersus RN42]
DDDNDTDDEEGSSGKGKWRRGQWSKQIDEEDSEDEGRDSSGIARPHELATNLQNEPEVQQDPVVFDYTPGGHYSLVPSSKLLWENVELEDDEGKKVVVPRTYQPSLNPSNPKPLGSPRPWKAKSDWEYEAPLKYEIGDDGFPITLPATKFSHPDVIKGFTLNGNKIVWQASIDKTTCRLYLIGDAIEEKDLRFWTQYEGPEPEGDFEYLVKEQLKGRLKELFFSHCHYEYELAEDFPFGISANRWGNRDTKAPKAMEIGTARIFLGFYHQTDCFFPELPTVADLKGIRSNAGGQTKDVYWYKSQFNDLAVNSRKFHTASNENILYGEFGTEINGREEGIPGRDRCFLPTPDSGSHHSN